MRVPCNLLHMIICHRHAAFLILCNRHALGTLEQTIRLVACIFYHWLSSAPQPRWSSPSASKYGALSRCHAYNRFEGVSAELPMRSALLGRFISQSINEITPSSRLVVEVFRGNRKALCGYNRHEGVFAPRCSLAHLHWLKDNTVLEARKYPWKPFVKGRE